MTNYTHIDNLLNEMKDLPADSILSRVLEKNDAVNVTLFGFAPGQGLTEHTAARPAILLFLEGEATLTLGTDQKTVTAGSFTYMPAHLPHGIEAHTAVTMLLIMTKP